jgi:hydroxyethylthiazole kinase
MTNIVQYSDPEIVQDLQNLRSNNPLTHCMTNIVVTGFTANVLLAIGASPAMVIAIEEVEDFARIAGALLINVGTVTGPDSLAMMKAARAANESGTPWVLDPVAAGALKFRTNVVAELLKFRPSVIKGNASEILAVAGADGGAKGVDSTLGSDEAIRHAQELSIITGSVVVITGAVDYITDGKSVISVPGGHPIMTKVTGTGCALGALIAAFTTVAPTPLRAATSGCAIFAAAGERAAQESQGPGSFAVNFLNQLALISG